MVSAGKEGIGRRPPIMSVIARKHSNMSVILFILFLFQNRKIVTALSMTVTGDRINIIVAMLK